MTAWLPRFVRRVALAKPIMGTARARTGAGNSCFLHLAIGRPAVPVAEWCEDLMLRGLALITVAPPAGASAGMLDVIRQEVAPGRKHLFFPDGFICGRAIRYLQARLPAELKKRIEAARNERGERWPGPESRGIGLEVRALLEAGKFGRPSLSLNHVWVKLAEAALDERR